MDISLAGLLGAVVGTILAAAIYAPMARALERRLQRHLQPQPEDRAARMQEIALMRRGLFTADILLCAGIGYWIGQRLAG
jgi:hypothetical protein